MESVKFDRSDTRERKRVGVAGGAALVITGRLVIISTRVNGVRR